MEKMEEKKITQNKEILRGKKMNIRTGGEERGIYKKNGSEK
jgi:hypothetical protein